LYEYQIPIRQLKEEHLLHRDRTLSKRHIWRKNSFPWYARGWIFRCARI